MIHRASTGPGRTGVLSLMLLAAIAASCGFFGLQRPQVQPRQGQVATGRLNIHVDSPDMTRAKTLYPSSYALAVQSYKFEGTGPSGSSFSFVGTEVSHLESAVLPGDWTITVSAWNATNATGDKLGEGSASITVAAEKEATLSVTVSPLSGEGTLHLRIMWPTAIIASPPGLFVLLTPLSGSALDIASRFTVSVDAGTGKGTADFSDLVPAGAWDATFKIKDSSFTGWSWGQSEAIIVVKDKTTEGIYDLDAGKLNQPPAKPIGQALVEVSTTTAKVAWTDVSIMETGYRVERDSGSGYAPISGQAPDFLLTEDTTLFADAGLSPHATYSYRLLAANSWGNSAYSDPVPVFTGSNWDEAKWDINCWE